MTRGSARRTALRVALAAYLLAVLRITQWPELADESALGALEAALAWAHAHGLPAAVDVVVVEAVANVVMFVPFGALVPLVAGWRPWVVVGVAAAFSTAIELSQFAFFPERVATVQDVVMNTLGAAVGVAGLVLVRRRARRAGRAEPAGQAGRAGRAGTTAPGTTSGGR